LGRFGRHDGADAALSWQDLSQTNIAEEMREEHYRRLFGT
jgi:hypothetical protein